ncbi:hypothetical protein IWX91DRAFT_402480, partial [Phyllosticta citricarpa]
VRGGVGAFFTCRQREEGGWNLHLPISTYISTCAGFAPGHGLGPASRPSFNPRRRPSVKNSRPSPNHLHCAAPSPVQPSKSSGRLHGSMHCQRIAPIAAAPASIQPRTHSPQPTAHTHPPTTTCHPSAIPSLQLTTQLQLPRLQIHIPSVRTAPHRTAPPQRQPLDQPLPLINQAPPSRPSQTLRPCPFPSPSAPLVYTPPGSAASS